MTSEQLDALTDALQRTVVTVLVDGTPIAGGLDVPVPDEEADALRGICAEMFYALQCAAKASHGEVGQEALAGARVKDGQNVGKGSIYLPGPWHGKRDCPACGEGLLVGRRDVDGNLLATDACLLCGQAVIYDVVS